MNAPHEAGPDTDRPHDAAEASPDDELPPVVVDLGKVKRKKVKALKRGEGPLLDTIDEVVAAVEHELADELEGRQVLPVVLVVERKPKKRRSLFDL